MLSRVYLMYILAMLLTYITGCCTDKKSDQPVTDASKKSVVHKTAKPDPQAAGVSVAIVGNKKVTRTTTVTEKVDELVPPPPVWKSTVTQETHTEAAIDGVPVRPIGDLHEKPAVTATATVVGPAAPPPPKLPPDMRRAEQIPDPANK